MKRWTGLKSGRKKALKQRAQERNELERAKREHPAGPWRMSDAAKRERRIVGTHARYAQESGRYRMAIMGPLGPVVVNRGTR